MKSLLRISIALLALSLSACANFKVVKQFAGETGVMTSAVKGELSHIATLCDAAADMRLLLAESGVGDLARQQASKKVCREEAEQVIAYQTITTDVIDLYAKTLLAMVDDSNFALESAINSTGNKLKALKTQDGALIDGAMVGALTRTLDLLSEVIIRHQREEGIRRLVAAAPDLIASGQQIRSFLENEYLGSVGRSSVIAGGGLAMLENPTALAAAEPIRSAELRRTMKSYMAALGKRTKGQEVHRKVLAAVNEWIALVPLFERDALGADPQALVQRLREFGMKAGAAREAVDAAS